MGIRLFSHDEYDSPIIGKIVPKGNPSPSNYKILETLTFGNMLIVEIQYPDCNNYEGKKILVYEGVTISQLKKQKLIDPHFSENKDFYSPVARFEPTQKGWKMAESFAKMWSMKR
jgi:hypothetical protein